MSASDCLSSLEVPPSVAKLFRVVGPGKHFRRRHSSNNYHMPRYIARLRSGRVTKTRRSLSSVKLPSGDSQGQTTASDSNESNTSTGQVEDPRNEDKDPQAAVLQIDVSELDNTICDMESVLSDVSNYLLFNRSSKKFARLSNEKTFVGPQFEQLIVGANNRGRSTRYNYRW